VRQQDAYTQYARGGGSLCNTLAPFSRQHFRRSLYRMLATMRDVPRLISSLALIFYIFFSAQFLQFTFHCNMRLTQFNIYFNHYLQKFMINYINYIVHVHAQKSNSLLHNNTVCFADCRRVITILKFTYFLVNNTSFWVYRYSETWWKVAKPTAYSNY